jgi:glycine/D-amino acid oxidase-like deaminating enzyme
VDRSLVVVGAGVFGASLARQCSRTGWDVTLVERVAPGHVRAGSGDESRIIRCGHGEDAWHAASARRAWALWHEIDPALVVPSGVLWLAHRDDGWEAASERTLRGLGIPCSRIDPADCFPSFAGDEITWGLWEPEAGVLRARDATKTLAAQAVSEGAELVLAEARPDGDAVVLDDGRRLEADRVVWACGAWLPALFDGLGLRITQSGTSTGAA